MTIQEAMIRVKEVDFLKGTVYREAEIVDIFPAPKGEMFFKFLEIYFKSQNINLAIMKTQSTDFEVCFSCKDINSIIFYGWLDELQQ